MDDDGEIGPFRLSIHTLTGLIPLLHARTAG
jgi:hypothetical protein